MLCEDHAVMDIVGQSGLDGCDSGSALHADNPGHGSDKELSYQLPIDSGHLQSSAGLAA